MGAIPIWVGVTVDRYRGTMIRINDAGTVAYAIGDTIGTYIGTIPNIAARNGGAGYITGLRLMKTGPIGTLGWGTLGVGSNANFTAHIYAVPPGTIADNTAWPTLGANWPNRIANVDFYMGTTYPTSDMGSDLISERLIHFWTQSTTRDLYFVLTANAIYIAPVNETYILELWAESY